ncbi:AAA family ATPase [Bacillus niameyensis]|uniref:AAA family ATPase n=1 Tax=Bacillus niameyensis TaxID=1522308 RepID=UPI0007807772|nr:SMC family ATPase [Bacillus niameyensis]
MKPLKLKMSAFGPYKNTEVIDFQELEDHQLFVISGNTGAGKTTIFDGICFALYGSASGQDRENQVMLRSDFADDDTHTAVELEFELNGRYYRILRQLGHVKQGNKTKTGEKYEFFESLNEREIPCVDRQIVSEINQKVEQLIGLTQDQFKQIVMLPQGEFRKLLTSQTENKEEILRRLFKTDSYKHIGDRLRERKRRVEEIFTQERQMQHTYIQSISATMPMREDSSIFHVLSQEHYNVTQVLTGLTEEAVFYEQQIMIDQDKYEKAYKANDEKQREFHQAQALNERFLELDRKETQLESLHSQVPLFTEKEKQLAAAERASTLQPYEKQANDWKKEEVEKTTTFELALRNKDHAFEQFEKVQQVYNQEEAKKAVREETSKKLNRLQEFLPIVKEIDERKQAIQKLRNEAKQTFDKLSSIQKRLDEKKEMLETNREIMKELDNAVIELPEKQQALLTMRDKVKVLIDFMNWSHKQSQLEREVAVKQQDYEKQRAEYLSLENAWLNNQAAMIASHLHDGEACPVCGSFTHPEKATSAKGVVTREQLEALKKQLDEKDSLYRDHVALLNTIVSQLKEKTEEVVQFGIRVEEVATVKEELVVAGKRLKVEVDQLTESRKRLIQLKEAVEKVNAEMQGLESEKVDCDQLLQKQKTAFETARAVYEDRLHQIPEEVRVLADLENEIAETEKNKLNLEMAWEQAQKDLQKAQENRTKALANLEHANKLLEETTEKKEAAILAFQEAVQKAGFDSSEAYNQAKMPESERQNFKKAIEQFKQNLSTAREQVSELKELLKDKSRIDLTVLQQELNDSKLAYERALSEWNQSKEYHQETTRLITMISATNERVRKSEEQLAILADLYDVIRGQNSHKISFERYLQIEYLERIIDAANGRLKNLSNGQYELIRSDRQESHGRQSGLALDVADSYTGQTRDVKTLSGGEKFNASLCLALGMSDVIQSFQGNISIETMFIDEGFGTLDEESLNKAIDTLVDLQQSGRMIGVISHVQELKTIFPAVLEVKKTKEGYSQTRFLLK